MTLNTVLLELTASAAGLNIDIICKQENEYYDKEIEIKYHDSGKCWIFVSAFARINTLFAIMDIELLLNIRGLNSLNNIKRCVLHLMPPLS